MSAPPGRGLSQEKIALVTAATTVTLREFDDLIDSSLSRADRVDLDDQDVKGECWILRGCKWVYMPFRFRVAYHKNNGQLSIVWFQYQRLDSKRWKSVRTTARYRAILREADFLRRMQPGG